MGDTAGIQSLEARAIDPATGAPLTFARVSATALPGPLAYAGFSTYRLIVPAETLLTLPVVGRDAYGNLVRPPPALSLDSARFGRPDSIARWIPRYLGYARFVVGAETLRIHVIWPRTVRFWARWTGAGGVAYADSGTWAFASLDTARVTGLCGLQGTARYMRSGSIVARIADTPLCEYPGYESGGVYLDMLTGLGSNVWASPAAEAIGYWRYSIFFARDSLVVRP